MNSELFTLNIGNTQQDSHLTRDIQKYLKMTKNKTIFIFKICFFKEEKF